MSDQFDPYREWLGIGPEAHPLDHYRLLGIERFENDPAVIHQAADARMSEVRIHQTGPRGRYTQQLLNEISAARVCLVEAGSKQAYDASLLKGATSTKVPPPAPPMPPPAPLATVQQEIPSVAPVMTTSIPTAKDDPEEVRGGLGKVVMGVVTVLIISAGIWGLGWWAGRQNSDAEQVQKQEDTPKKKDSPAELSTEVVVNQEATGEIGLAATVATLHGKTIRCEVNGLDGQIASWTDGKDWVSWKFKILKPGYFRAEVTYAAAQDAHQGTYLVQIDEEPSKVCTVESPMGTGGRTDEHFFFINRSGTHVLSVKAGNKPGKELMVLKSIRLRPK